MLLVMLRACPKQEFRRAAQCAAGGGAVLSSPAAEKICKGNTSSAGCFCLFLNFIIRKLLPE